MRCRDAEFDSTTRRAFGFVCWLSLACVVQAATASDDSAQRPAEQARLASRSLLLDLAKAGPRLIAVGERGHVLLSDDSAKTWRQARSVPTQALLTGVCFGDPTHGIAVGHDETILTTSDAGETWTLTHSAPEKQQPLLDVWCGDSGKAIAVGAYSSYYVTADNGATWTATRFEPAPRSNSPAVSEDDLPPEYHLNRIVSASPSRIYIAAEAGQLYRSDDGGTTWVTLGSPYEGSFFGALPLEGDDVLAFGLRGHLYRSTDAGASWQRVETGTTAMLNDAVRLDHNTIVIVGLSGTLLESDDGGRTFTLHQQADRKGLSAALPLGANAIVAVGEGGGRIFPVGKTP